MNLWILVMWFRITFGKKQKEKSEGLVLDINDHRFKDDTFYIYSVTTDSRRGINFLVSQKIKGEHSVLTVKYSNEEILSKGIINEAKLIANVRKDAKPYQ